LDHFPTRGRARLRATTQIIIPTLALLLGCSSSDKDDDGSGAGAGGQNSSAGGNGSGSGHGTGTGTGGSVTLPSGTGSGSGTSGSGGGTGDTCAAESSQTSLEPVYLAFAFDVSGSMGKLDKPYHDPVLKWEPVVAATEAFFASEDSRGIQASLTFFPIDDEDGRCDAETYATPDVPMTELPSTDFADAITAITPQSEDEWRGGTPTLAVIDGTIAFLEPLVAENPNAHYAIVLVTDGYPNGCDDDTIASVEAAVAAVSDTIPTYVIGVENPEGGPDVTTNLTTIAEAGGTEKYFKISTGDPNATQKMFQEAILGIREQTISCVVEIPPPPAGKTFDAGKVNVTLKVGGTPTQFGYDPTCTSENAWRYDDEAAPTQIELCESTCGVVQGALEATLDVEFGCERRVILK
jgi:hypothetical protein